MATETLDLEVDGRTYRVRVGPHEADYIRNMAAFVDQAVRRRRSEQPHLEATRLYVLAMLNMAHELHQEKAKNQTPSVGAAELKPLKDLLDEVLTDGSVQP